MKNKLTKNLLFIFKALIVIIFLSMSGDLFASFAQTDPDDYCADGYYCYGTTVQDVGTECNTRRPERCGRFDEYERITVTCDQFCSASGTHPELCKVDSVRRNYCDNSDPYSCDYVNDTCRRWGCVDYDICWSGPEPYPCCVDYDWIYYDCTTCDSPCWVTMCVDDNNVPWETNCCAACTDETCPPEEPPCNTDPGAPTLVAPTDGSVIDEGNYDITFDWDANGWGGSDCGSRSFRIQVDNNSDFSSPEHNSGGISESTTQETVNFDEPEDTYYWRVRATNEHGSVWSEVWSFDLNDLPPQAQFTNPTNDIEVGAGTTVTFSGDGADAGGAMTRMQIARYEPSTGTVFLDQPGGAVDEACSGASCTITREWTPTTADLTKTFDVYLNAFDENEPDADGRCTGAASIPPAWSDCNGSPDLVRVSICGDYPDAVTNPSPADGESDVDNISGPIELSWDPASYWGDTCGPTNNSYKVYANTKSGASCDTPDTYPFDTSPSYSQICDNNGTDNDCAPGFFVLGDTDYCWYVVADNGEYHNISDVWEFNTIDPLVYKNWNTVLYGDVYARSLSMDFPDVADYVDPWNPPHVSYKTDPTNPADVVDTLTLTSEDASINTDNLDSSYYPESQSNLYAKYANATYTWSPNYDGEPPASAIEITSDCDDMFNSTLDPDNIYEASVSCVQDGLTNLSGSDYQLLSDDPLVLYVTGTGDLRFEDAFQSTDDDSRILFITGSGVNVKIDGSLDSGDPVFSTRSLIEAGFVINSSIEFERDDPAADPVSSPDTSIVVEGPIITRNAMFRRNRGETNSYPSEIIKYNWYYLWKLTDLERRAGEVNRSGLFVSDVDWISEE